MLTVPLRYFFHIRSALNTFFHEKPEKEFAFRSFQQNESDELVEKTTVSVTDCLVLPTDMFPCLLLMVVLSMQNFKCARKTPRESNLLVHDCCNITETTHHILTL